MHFRLSVIGIQDLKLGITVFFQKIKILKYGAKVIFIKCEESENSKWRIQRNLGGLSCARQLAIESGTTTQDIMLFCFNQRRCAVRY